MDKIIVSPSILSADFANLERDIKKVENAGADWIHVDVMDGHFVPNITIGIPVVSSLRKVTNLLLDVHLMIENPEKYVEAFANAGADIITFHYEAIKDKTKTFELIRKIKSLGKKVGMSIKPKTSPNDILEFLSELDLLLVMTVEPGFGGQKFIVHTLDKVRELRELITNTGSQALIEVDGGVNLETGRQLVEVGADVLVAGNAVFKAPDMSDMIHRLKSL